MLFPDLEKTFNVGLSFDIVQVKSLELCLMLNFTEPYTCVLVLLLSVTLITFQGFSCVLER